jgi:hypothetical protein
MEQTGQTDLFDIKLTASGKLYIRKFVTISRAVILMGIILLLVHLASSIIRLIKYDPAIFAKNKLLLLDHKILPYYLLIYTFLFLLQFYYYWKTGSYLKKAIDYNDETVFNNSLTALYRYAVSGLFIFILVFLRSLFDLYFVIQYYLN